MFHLFHKWKYCKEYFSDQLMGRRFTNSRSVYRICKRCGKAQEFCKFKYINGIRMTRKAGWWENLDKAKTKFLRNIIRDEGDFYSIQFRKPSRSIK